MNLLNNIKSNPSRIMNPKNFLKGISGSLCFFRVFGDKTFISPKNYEGIFKTVSATWWHVKSFISSSSPRGCFSSELGYDTSSFSVLTSMSYYWLINGKYVVFSSLYNQVKQGGEQKRSCTMNFKVVYETRGLYFSTIYLIPISLIILLVFNLNSILLTKKVLDRQPI